MDLRDELRKTIRNIPDFPSQGIQFKDITPILESPVLTRGLIDEFVKRYEGVKIDAIAGVESRGFLFGVPLAMELNVPFIMVRKKGKLPGETVSHKYVLEYGSAEIEIHKGVIKSGMNILVHDDLLATGGTACATAELVKKEGGNLAGFAFLIELSSLNGRKKLLEYDEPIISILTY